MFSRLMSAWSFGNPLSLRFVEAPPAEPPVAPPAEPPAEPGYQGAEFYTNYGLDEKQVGMVKDFKDEAAMAKAYCETKTTLGTGFRMPENLTDGQKEELNIRQAKIKGVPETADGYQLVDAPDEVIAPGVRIDPEGLERLKEFGLTENIPPKLLNDLYQFYKQEMRTAHAKNQQVVKEAREATFKRISDLHGGEAAATEGMEYVKQYLKQFSDGPDDWAQCERLLGLTGGGDHHILVRALWGPAQAAMSEATSPGAQANAARASEAGARMKYLQEEYPKQWKYMAQKDKYAAEFKQKGWI